MYKIVQIGLVAISIIFSAMPFADNMPALTAQQIAKIQASSAKYNYDGIPVLVLSGSNIEMGIQYGYYLQPQLKQILSVLEDYFIKQHHLTYDALLAQADLLYRRYPTDYQELIHGVAIGSGLSVNDLKILNAMETLGQVLPAKKVQGACAFLFIPSYQSYSGSSMIGRNYDYPAPFNQLAKYLSVTILKQPGLVATAFVSIPGEIYCPSCINAHGVFMELNNGSPSGGATVNNNTETMLVRMLSTLQHATSLPQVAEQLDHVSSDFSLIVDAADAKRALSFEYSSANLGMRYYYPELDHPFAVTNFFLSSDWAPQHLQSPNDTSTWMGVTRRNNLLNLANQSKQINLAGFERLMETPLEDGGGAWNMTIYQLIVDESDNSLYIRTVGHANQWAHIPLAQLFGSVKA